MCTAAGRAVALRLFGSCNRMVQEHIPALGNVHAAAFYIAVSRRLIANRLQLTLHYADNDLGKHKADHKSYGDPNHRQRLAGKIGVIIRLAAFRLGNKPVAQGGIGRKGAGKIAV